MFRIITASMFALAASFSAHADYAGLAGSVGTPTIGGCGTGATVAAGSLDHIGTVNVGTGLVTSCSLNFSTTLVGTVRCTVSAYGLLTPALTATKTVTNTGITVTFVASVAGAQIDYNCFIN